MLARLSKWWYGETDVKQPLEAEKVVAATLPANIDNEAKDAKDVKDVKEGPMTLLSHVQKAFKNIKSVVLEGPVSLTEWRGINARGKPMHIYVLGDRHERLSKCVTDPNRIIWSMLHFVRYAHASVPKSVVDLFLEYPVPAGPRFTYQHEKKKRGEEKGQGSESGYLVHELFRDLSHCLYTNEEVERRTFCLLDKEQYRVHQADIRQQWQIGMERADEAAGTLFVLYMALLSRVGKPWNHPMKISEVLQMQITSLRKYHPPLTIEEGLIALKVKTRKQVYGLPKKYTDILISTKEELKWGQLVLLDQFLALIAIVEKDPDGLSWPPETSTLAEGLFMMMSETMDNYLLARLFKVHTNPAADVQYAIITVGNAHAFHYAKLFTALGFANQGEAIYKDEDMFSDKQCIDISNLKWPFFGADTPQPGVKTAGSSNSKSFPKLCAREF
jgi:hypothetical protein